jgi:hypothetical protein
MRGGSMRSAVVGSFLVVALAGPAAAAPPHKGKGPGFFEDATQVVAAFKAKVKAPFLITELNISPDSASIQTQDPSKKDTFDDYNYQRGGAVSEPEPVRVFTVNCKKGFSIDEADYAGLPALLKDAAARLNLEDGEVTHANLSRGVFCKEPRWMIFVDGKRKNGMVEYDPKGKFRNTKIM